MGRQARAKRQRREAEHYAASLTACQGTWLERAPDAAELQRIRQIDLMLRQYRLQAMQMGRDKAGTHALSLDVYREPEWAALHLDDWLIEDVLEVIGEPPIAVDPDDTAFTAWLLRALGTIAHARFRRALAEQSRRFLPQYAAAGRIKEALAIEHNAYMTVMSEAATPLLVQMLVGGLARYYETHDEAEIGAIAARPADAAPDDADASVARAAEDA